MKNLELLSLGGGNDLPPVSVFPKGPRLVNFLIRGTRASLVENRPTSGYYFSVCLIHCFLIDQERGTRALLMENRTLASV